MADSGEIARPVARSLLARARAGIPALTPSEARVAHYFLDSPQDVIFQSVSEVAQSAGAAASTVVRCAHQLGFRGFQDLKIALAHELGTREAPLREEAGATALTSGVLDHVTQVLAEVVRSAATTIDPVQFTAVAEALSAARRVVLAGLGASAPVVQDAAFRLTTIGVPAEAPAEPYARQLSAHTVGPGDVLLAVSHTGSTRETVACAQAARAAGAFTAALTSRAWSALAEAVQHPLVARPYPVEQELEAQAGRLAHIAVLDALVVAVSRARPERTARHQELYDAIRAEHQLNL